MSIYLPDWEIVRVTFAPGQDPPAPAELLLDRPPEDFWAPAVAARVRQVLDTVLIGRTRTLYYKVERDTGTHWRRWHCTREGGGVRTDIYEVSADEAERASAIELFI